MITCLPIASTFNKKPRYWNEALKCTAAELPNAVSAVDMMSVGSSPDKTWGVKQVSDKIWLVTFMHYDLGFFDHQTCRLEPVDNPFEPKVLPMSPA